MFCSNMQIDEKFFDQYANKLMAECETNFNN